MKYFAYLLPIAIILLASACSKENIKGNSTLSGKWKLVETLADPGDGSGKWQQVLNGTEVQFYANGTLSGTAFPIYTSYNIRDSVTLTFTQPDKTIQNFWYNIRHDTLFMTWAGPIMCIEACGMRFKKER
jgi:hypothetical protein